jgi:hypothetical protein
MYLAYNHEPLWRADWRDIDGYLVETRLLDEIGRMRLLRDPDMVADGGETAVEVVIVSLNDNIADSGHLAEEEEEA